MRKCHGRFNGRRPVVYTGQQVAVDVNHAGVPRGLLQHPQARFGAAVDFWLPIAEGMFIQFQRGVAVSELSRVAGTARQVLHGAMSGPLLFPLCWRLSVTGGRLLG